MGEDELVYADQIDGKKFRLVLIFDNYSERDYKNDFQEFVDYQKKLSLTGEKGETDFRFWENKISLTTDVDKKDFKFWEIKEFVPPFDFFKKKSVDYLGKAVASILRANPKIIVSDELNLEIKVIRIKERSYYIESHDDLMTPEYACYSGAGIWFMQAIAAPLFYFNRVDFSYITRFFLHELQHFADNMKGYLQFDSKYADKIKRFSKKKSAYCLNYLYTTIFNLREEGYPDFVMRKEVGKMEINMEGVREYNRNLELLIKLRLKKDAEELFEKKIGWENMTASGEYACGRVMCLTIAMYVAKIKLKPCKISVGKEVFSGHDFPELDKIMSTNKIIYVSDFSNDVLQNAAALIEPSLGFHFIKLYEEACNYLGISEKNRVMTRDRFVFLQRKAMDFAAKERAKRLKKSGFVNLG